jgi:carbon-monoxide dehydrogenase medium subunit
MISHSFDYASPKSLDEAVALITKDSNARILAGGQELVPQMQLRQISPGKLVDLRLIPGLRGTTRRAGDDFLYVGAMTTASEIAADMALQTHCRALVDAATSMGDVQVRNCATIGGNLAGGHPGADLAAAVLVLNASIKAIGSNGARMLGVAEFFIGPYDTDLENEIITEVRLPLLPDRSGSAYEKIKNPASGYPLCGVAAFVTLTQSGDVASCRVAVTGATSHPVRLRGVENDLTGSSATAANIAAAAVFADHNLTFVSDLSASAEYRANLTQVLVERALASAADRAGRR